MRERKPATKKSEPTWTVCLEMRQVLLMAASSLMFQ